MIKGAAGPATTSQGTQASESTSEAGENESEVRMSDDGARN